MAVAHEGFAARALEIVQEMLDDCARFQEWCGVDTAAAAASFIIESDAGEKASPPYALVWVEEPDRTEETGLHTYAHAATIGIELVKAQTDGDTPAEAIRRAWSDAAVVADELRAQLGQAGKLNRARITAEHPMAGSEVSKQKFLIFTRILIEAFTR